MKFFFRDDKATTKELQSRSANAMLKFLSDQFTLAVADLNETLQDSELKLVVGKPFNSTEKIEGNKQNISRLSINNSHVVLSLRGMDSGSIEAFLLPAAQFVLVPGSEYSSRSRFRLEWSEEKKCWQLDGGQISENDLRLLVLASTNDILKYSHSKMDIPKEGVRLRIGDLSLTTGLRDLLFEKAQLIADLLAQQENLQSHVAQELHDSVIADLLFLRREVSDGQEIDKNKVCGAIDEIVQNLREICTDFSTTDVKNWGLWDALCALVDRLKERSSMEIHLDSKRDLPKLPHDVSLQIYRMVQESLNNAIKHSRAANVSVTTLLSGSELGFVVADDGKGFELNKLPRGNAHKHGGMGISVLRERAERLSALGYPATVAIQSSANEGTRINIRVDISATDQAKEAK